MVGTPEDDTTIAPLRGRVSPARQGAKGDEGVGPVVTATAAGGRGVGLVLARLLVGVGLPSRPIRLVAGHAARLQAGVAGKRVVLVPCDVLVGETRVVGAP